MPGRRVAAAIAAVASGLLLASCSSGAQAEGGSWAAVPQIPGAAGASFASVAAGPDRFVVVGATPRSGQLGHAAAWSSTDGRTWTAATDDHAFDQHQMVAVASGPAGFAAAGLTCNTQECGESAAWTSTDGQTWRAAAEIPPAGGLTAHTSSIAAGGPGWIVGATPFPGAMDHRRRACGQPRTARPGRRQPFPIRVPGPTRLAVATRRRAGPPAA